MYRALNADPSGSTDRLERLFDHAAIFTGGSSGCREPAPRWKDDLCPGLAFIGPEGAVSSD